MRTASRRRIRPCRPGETVTRLSSGCSRRCRGSGRCGRPRRGRSAEIDSIAWSSSSKSNRAAFSAIRSGVEDFGKTMSPRWRCQRRVTWAGVRPTCSAILVIVGSSSTPPCAIGDQASTRMPASRLADRGGLVGEVGVHLDLVDRGHHVGLLGEPLEVGGLEVRDADGAGAALLLELDRASSRWRRSRRRTAWAAASGSGTGRPGRGRGRPGSGRRPGAPRRARGSRC